MESWTVGPMTGTATDVLPVRGFDLVDAGARQSMLSASREKALDAGNRGSLKFTRR